MIIALDYDNTYTADPEFWNKFILDAEEAGHKVICVTGRSDTEDFARPVMESIGKLCQVVFAGPKWKRDAALAKGWKVDVWIDDMPEMVAKQVLLGSHG